MNERRAEVQRKMVVHQILEINDLIAKLQAAEIRAKTTRRTDQLAWISTETAAKTIKNLEDFRDRHLTGLLAEG